MDLIGNVEHFSTNSASFHGHMHDSNSHTHYLPLPLSDELKVRYTEEHLFYKEAMTIFAAANVRSISSSVWARLVKPASY